MNILSPSFTLPAFEKSALSRTLVALSCFLLASYANSSEDVQSRYSLLLAGGGLKTCSSMSTKNCSENVFSGEQKSAILYTLNEGNLKKFNKTSAFSALEEAEKMKINKAIQHIYAVSTNEIITRSRLRNLFEATGNLALYQGLADPVYYALLDSLEADQRDTDGHRKREVTALTHNKNTHSVAVYYTFVEQAAMRVDKRKVSKSTSKPRIAVITASSRDPFEVADFYLSVFADAGAEVVWLPLDKTYRQARELENQGFPGCSQLAALRASNLSFYREDIYPKRVAQQSEYCQQPLKMLAVLDSVQGVFFNGGDQSLTLAALKYSDDTDSEELALIRSKVAAGEMIVGGTSAGTAVQAGGAFNGKPVPMLTNGHSELAMQRGAFATPPPSQRCAESKHCGGGLKADDLTYRAQGGTGLFSIGLMDTHFSERDRETRLAVFTHESGQRLGFGVDEATALLVGQSADSRTVNLEVVGQGGVYIVDTAEGHLKTSAKGRELSGISHYLTHGSKAEFGSNTGLWTFAPAGKRLSKQDKLKPLEQGVWRDATRKLCGSTEILGWQQYGNQYRLKASDATRFFSDETTGHCSYVNLPFVIAYTQTE